MSQNFSFHAYSLCKNIINKNSSKISKSTQKTQLPSLQNPPTNNTRHTINLHDLPINHTCSLDYQSPSRQEITNPPNLSISSKNITEPIAKAATPTRAKKNFFFFPHIKTFSRTSLPLKPHLQRATVVQRNAHAQPKCSLYLPHTLGLLQRALDSPAPAHHRVSRCAVIPSREEITMTDPRAARVEDLWLGIDSLGGG